MGCSSLSCNVFWIPRDGYTVGSSIILGLSYFATCVTHYISESDTRIESETEDSEKYGYNLDQITVYSYSYESTQDYQDYVF